MDSDTLGTESSDGWLLLVQEPRRHVKSLTYDVRTLPRYAGLLKEAGIALDLTFALDWRRTRADEVVILTTNSDDLVTLSVSSGKLLPTDNPERQRQAERLTYVGRLREGLMVKEAILLTKWLRSSADPLPSRLRSELRSRNIADDQFGVADALVRGIDEILLLIQTDESYELVYDFSSAPSEEFGVLRHWKALGETERATFRTEFAAGTEALGLLT